MNPDPASLDNLRDIAELPPVPWWPLAPGWWVALALALIAAAYFSFRAWRSWKANAFRRAALMELATAPDISAVSEILKRAALATFPRADVAALTGAPWCDWLEKTGGEEIPNRVRVALTHGVFDQKSDGNSDETTAFASAWISGHRSHDPTVSELEKVAPSPTKAPAEGNIAC